MITLTNITFENDKVTLTLEDFLKLIKQDKLTEVECKFEPKPMAPATAFLQVEPKPMAFDTKQELDDYVKNNPNATCKGVSTEELLRFLEKNKGKYFFLKEANFRLADFLGFDFRNAYLCRADFSGAKYTGETIFPAGFIMSQKMIKL